MASGYSDLSEIQGDRRTYGASSKPPKINLLNEKPRRESFIEQQLSTTIARPGYEYQRSGQQQVEPIQQQVYHVPRSQNTNQYNSNILVNETYNTSSTSNFVPRPGTSGGGSVSMPTYNSLYPSTGAQYQPLMRDGQYEVKTTTTSLTTTSSGQNQFSAYADLEAELAAKEAKLKRELAYLNQYHSPWMRPKQIREPRKEAPTRVNRNDPRWVKELNGPESRPNSRASSTRSTTEADLMEKAAKLLQDVEELERKPLNTQQILIERGAKIKPSSSQSQDVSSIHTAVINVPDYEVNNKSPLPFAFDNFSTLGVRGNIASVGATEPESPYPPIFPTIKRTPSPNKRW